jgi:hypothetical protein
VLLAMQYARFGRLINIDSEAGRGGSVYATAKGEMIAFTKSMARENARYGTTANVIVPGRIDTPMLRQAVVEGGERLLDGMESTPRLLRRFGTSEEVAAAVFLATDAAGYIHRRDARRVGRNRDWRMMASQSAAIDATEADDVATVVELLRGTCACWTRTTTIRRIREDWDDLFCGRVEPWPVEKHEAVPAS